MSHDAYQAAEAMRATCAELAGRNAEINRRNGYEEHAEVQLSIADRIRRIDVGAVVDKALQHPVSPAEVMAFEQEARRLYINDFRRRDDGLYAYGLTQRFWEMWRAGARFHAG